MASVVSKKIKVMRIIARLNVGGPAVHCTLLSESLQKHGFETTLVTGSTETGEASYESLFLKTAPAYRLEKLPKMKRSLNFIGDLASFVRLVALMRKERPDIVHTHTAKAGFLGRAAAILNRTPVVVHTYHGHVLSGYFSKTFSKMITWIERILGLKTTALVTLSPQLKEILSGQFRVAPEEKFHVVPLGRDLQSFLAMPRNSGRIRREFSISPETVLLGIIGRLVPIKAHGFLLDALEKVHTGTPWKLLVVGEGPLLGELKARVESSEKLRDRILFLGWRSDLPELFSDLDVSVLSSLNEGTPLSIIEAFGSGCPVLSTDVGGVRDMLTIEKVEGAVTFGAEGLLVPSQDIGNLALALKKMIDDRDLRERCSIAGRQRAMAYSDEALSERVAQLYRALMNSALSV